MDQANRSVAPTTKPRKIFVYRPHGDRSDCAGFAYTDEGVIVAQHVSSSLGWFQRDMGLHEGSECKHDAYSNAYPDGRFELVQVIGRDALQEIIDAGEVTGLSFEDSPKGAVIMDEATEEDSK